MLWHLYYSKFILEYFLNLVCAQFGVTKAVVEGTKQNVVNDVDSRQWSSTWSTTVNNVVNVVVDVDSRHHKF